MFQFKTFKPNIKLQKWVKSYWFVDYNETLDVIKKEKIILPYDNVCLLMIIDIQKNISYSDVTLKKGIYVCPPTLNRHNLNLESNIYYVDISLYPGVFYKLFGIPVCELEDRVYEIKELSLNFDISIIDLLFELKGSTLSSLNTLDEYLFKIFENMQEDSLLSNLYELTKNPNLENFYNQNRLSIRQIQRKVKDFTGLAPKSIERVNRFYNTLKLIKSNENNINFKNIIFENNFYDQSSFIKEFKFFSGTTPSLFILNCENFLQYKCTIFC